MIRKASLSALLLTAACGPSTPAPTTTPRESLGSETHANKNGVPVGSTGGGASPAQDPALQFRLAFQNPGGMWMPQQMVLDQHVRTFKDMGVKIDPRLLANPLEAPLNGVVSLGGCTGSFVSSEGLVVTNHHCVQGSLQLNSDAQHDYVENGFLAKTKADELPAGPAQRVMVAQAFTDVTKTLRAGLEDIKDPIARKDELERRGKQLIADCEKGRAGVRCSVSNFFHGGLYELIEMLEIKDVRLVYVPHRQVGDYGGEEDNWEWPRHTGDWSFYRAYVGKDGKPADPSPDNVPFHPKAWLHVTTSGLKAGDFVMITGYPGSTSRTDTASTIHHDLEWFYPYLIEWLQQRYKIAENHIGDAGETRIKATTTKQSIQNGLEKFQGILQGFHKNPELIKQKDELDAKAKTWASQPGREEYKSAIDKLEALLAEARKSARVDFDRGQAFGGSRLLGTAVSLTRWADERTKKDPERKPGFQERDLDRARAGQKQLVKQFDAALDRDAFRLALTRALALPEAERPWLALLLDAKKGQKIDEAVIDKTLDAWYKSPLILDEKLRLELLTKGTAKDLKASKDPFIAAAQRIWPVIKAEEKKTDTRAGEMILVEPMYVEAMRQAVGGALAPDANGTLRVTYGTIKPLHPGSAQADWPFTIGSQILAKNRGSGEFDAPKKELEALQAKKFGPYADAALDRDLPIDFLSDLDITGGNSGSPTLNDKGELVGLAFDGNKEGLASDAVFDGKTTRTIQVDARYMIWTMDALDDAHHLIKEMGLQPKF